MALFSDEIAVFGPETAKIGFVLHGGLATRGPFGRGRARKGPVWTGSAGGWGVGRRWDVPVGRWSFRLFLVVVYILDAGRGVVVPGNLEGFWGAGGGFDRGLERIGREGREGRLVVCE